MQTLLNFIKPVVSVFVAVSGIIALLLGALADPQGFANQLICGAIDMVAFFLPSTPEDLQISSLIDSAASDMPLVGRRIVNDIFQSIFSIASISFAVKIYKLIPFKAT